jgi:oligoribonuclease NrnB/cAMP/cGMP phosphodiesterase (DHH superfamily)
MSTIENPKLVKLIGIDYVDVDSHDLSFLTKEDEVIMVDFSFPLDKMLKIKDSTKSFVWIDHHKTSLDACKDLVLEGLQVDGISGCELTYMYFKMNLKDSSYVKEQAKDLLSKIRIKCPIVYWLGRYDVWDKSQSNWSFMSKLQLGLRTMDLDPSIPEALEWWFKKGFLCDDLDILKYCEAGIEVSKYLSVNNKKYIKDYGYKASIIGFEELSSFALNTGNKGSGQFGSLIEEYDVCIRFVFNGEKFDISFYSQKDNVDCSVIAKTYGGGGHKGAAGCVISDIPFEKI